MTKNKISYRQNWSDQDQQKYHQQMTMLELHDLATLKDSECGVVANQNQENEEWRLGARMRSKW